MTNARATATPAPYEWLDGLENWCGSGRCLRHHAGPSWWVAAGSPSARDGGGDTASAFVRAAEAAGARAALLTVTAAPAAPPVVERGSQLVLGWEGWWSPADWPQTLAASSSLRAQVRRARSKGVSIRELQRDDLAGPWADTVNRLARRWLARREMAPLGFVVKVPDDLARVARDHGGRVWIATVKGYVVALAVAFPLPEPGHWLLQHVLRLQRAPNGTSEALIDAALAAFAQSAASAPAAYVSLGMVPLAGDVPPLLRYVGRLTQGLFDFRGLASFKEKMRPHHRTRVHLIYGGGGAASAVRALWALLAAFADQRPGRFMVSSIARAPSLLIHLLAWLLVPWTLLLAFAAPPAWFPSSAARWGWVLFDVLLSLGFFSWRRRHHYGLLMALTAAVGVDAALTTWEVFSYNFPRGASPPELAACAVALGGPWLAFALLVRAAVRLKLPAPIPIPQGLRP